VVLETSRLRLRRWREEDREPFAQLNADPGVMTHFVSTLTREQSDAVVDVVMEKWARDGFCFWAVEIPGVTAFAGFIGVSRPRFDAPFMPAVEIGWRLARAYWNQGYATEGALASLGFAFDRLDLDEVVALAVPRNKPSLRVMEKLGMTRNPADDFDHPLVPRGHELRRHVLYRISRAAWKDRAEVDAPIVG